MSVMVKFKVKVVQVITPYIAKNVVKWGFDRRLPPDGHNLLLFVPCAFKPISTFSSIMNDLRSVFKPHYKNPTYVRFNGLGLSDIAVPSSFQVDEGDIVEIECKINNLGGGLNDSKV